MNEKVIACFDFDGTLTTSDSIVKICYGLINNNKRHTGQKNRWVTIVDSVKQINSLFEPCIGKLMPIVIFYFDKY